MTCNHWWFACEEGGYVCADCGAETEDDMDFMNYSNLVGGKYDVDKADLTLLPLEPLEEIAAVLMAGANKYTHDGWKSIPDMRRRYTAALLRHAHAYASNDHPDLDEETKRSHIAHAACCCLFLLWGEKNRKDEPTWPNQTSTPNLR